VTIAEVQALVQRAPPAPPKFSTTMERDQLIRNLTYDIAMTGCPRDVSGAPRSFAALRSSWRCPFPRVLRMRARVVASAYSFGRAGKWSRALGLSVTKEVNIALRRLHWNANLTWGTTYESAIFF